MGKQLPLQSTWWNFTYFSQILPILFIGNQLFWDYQMRELYFLSFYVLKVETVWKFSRELLHFCNSESLTINFVRVKKVDFGAKYVKNISSRSLKKYTNYVVSSWFFSFQFLNDEQLCQKT